MKVVDLKFENQVAILTIQRPEALNALNSQVLEELAAALSKLETASYQDCRCVVITGAGEKAFVAGADIKEINALDLSSAHKFAEHGQKLFRRIESLKIPVIAAVNGFALGGGLELALSCDFIYASDQARMGLPEVTLGLIPGFGGTVRLSRVVGLARARELIYSGEMLTAQQAFDCGLVNRIFSPLELMPAVLKIANVIAQRGPIAIAAAKRSILKTFDQDIDHGMQIEAKEFSMLFSSQDVREGTSAFIEKRKAQFQGK